LQFGSGYLRYSASDVVPTESDLNAGKAFINIISNMDGEVYVPSHGYLSVLAEKKSFLHPMGLVDITASDIKGEIRVSILNEIRDAIREKRFAAIILDSPDEGFPLTREEKDYLEINKHYKFQKKVFKDDSVFWPVSGMKTRPENIYIPR
jgi:hypothetical protein